MYSIPKVTKILQSLPKYFLEESIKDVYESNTDLNTHLIGNVNEAPICLEQSQQQL